MKTYEFNGKTIEETTEKALKELKIETKDAYFYDQEETSGLFKTKKTCLKVLLKDDVIKFSKKFIEDVAKMMNLEIKLEAQKREKHIKINMYSNNNSILIGKNGKTMKSLQDLIKSGIQNKTGFRVNLILDVEDYKENQHKNLEYQIKRIAKDVEKSGVEAKLDIMNSYERRIVHNVCNEFEKLYTESVGEEPNRYVVIKKK